MYREVTMLEVKEVLRLWREGVPTKRLAGQLGLDPKTVRRYLRAAAAAGLRAEHGAVSSEVAAAMADGAWRRFAVDVGVSVTGVAGPEGGSAEMTRALTDG